MKFFRGLVAQTAACVALLTSSASAEPFKSAFSISIWGLPLAELKFDTVIDSKSFSMQGSLVSSALADIVEPIRGTAASSGAMGKTGAIPKTYVLKYTYGKKSKRTSIDLGQGNVLAYENVPPLKKREPWIDVTPEQLIGTFDPISGFIIKANSLDEVCGRTISVFDGEVRADLRLNGGIKGVFSTKGYSGPAITCNLQVDPISGYRKGKKQIEYLRNSKNMSLTFAPVGDTGTYAPVRARIGTQIGTVSVNATRFGG